MNSRLRGMLRAGLTLHATLLLGAAAHAQSPTTLPASDNPPDLNAKIERLTQSLQQTQVQLAESRTEIQRLRATLEEVLQRLQPPAVAAEQASAGVPAQIATSPAGQAQISQEDWDLLNAKVEEQRQTKVESASKFRLRLSGLALFNAFGDSGRVDNLDLPSIAVPKLPGAPRGGTGASVRQSTIGLTGFGPVLLGAKTSADLHLDFYGGLPAGYASNSSGLGHIRLARIRFDWQDTSAVAGLDYPFFSPNLPTTYMSLAVPGFASAGNLWAWTPTIRVERRFAGALSPFKIEAGFLDPSAETNNAANTFLRVPNGTEGSHQPTYAARLSANRHSEDRPLSMGVSAIYAPQHYFNGYEQTGWGGVLDWKFPLLPRTELAGQFFTGRGIDGFGGVPLSPYPPPNVALYNAVTARLLGNIGVIGGWTQFKVRLDARSEFNAAVGSGGRNSERLRKLLSNAPGNLIPARNEMMFANYIFKPRSDLLFSAEYRRFRTYEVLRGPDTAGQVGLALGFLF